MRPTMPRAVLAAMLVAAAVQPSTAAEFLSVTAHRPHESSWARTQCGSPAGSHPAVPPGQYSIGVDYPGHDINTGCKNGYENGCVLPADATPSDCEASCNSTKDCVLYVFAPANCSKQSGPVCWVKSAVAKAVPNSGCRNSRVMGQPASKGTDIPSKWGASVTASSTPLPAYPRPQMARGTAPTLADLRDAGDNSVWTNLNGLWEWEPAVSDVPSFGKPLSGSILVPFPVESCLSGVAPNSSESIVMKMWYRLSFDASRTSATSATGATLLHFGAIDWTSAVYLNGKLLGNNTGGYNGFSFDVTTMLKPTSNELLVYAFDPSETGHQPNGKQRISAISNPGGDTYTPSSGIWQTVWLEAVPTQYIAEVHIDQASLSTVTVTADVVGASAGTLQFKVTDASGSQVATGTGSPSQPVSISVPNAQTWSTTNPYLYDLSITIGTDTVVTYFGLRTIALGDGPYGKRPLLNGKYTFFAGFLDQSFWPDGLYTAPTDDALAYDIQVVPMFGLNMIRLHQKVNPERWYYHADRLGVAVFQDMVQKYGGASADTIPYFVNDLQAMIKGRGNHPSILQIETFNEGDCWSVFKQPPYDVAGIVAMAKKLAPNRLIDTDSGGGANNLHIGDVNDLHTYPWPGNPAPSSTQYGMVGEFGGLGAFQDGHMWTPDGCFAYLHTDTASEQAATYIKMAGELQARVGNVSASVYTQTTDLERECDGYLNYDRTNKFSDSDTKAIFNANQAIIKAADKL